MRICELVKRRLKDAGLPSRLSPHSFRVTGITDLLSRACRWKRCSTWPGTPSRERPRLYDRRQKKVKRNLVERISI